MRDKREATTPAVRREARHSGESGNPFRSVAHTLLVFLIASPGAFGQPANLSAADFTGKPAWFHLEQLVSFGERYTGSPGHQQAKDYMRSILVGTGGRLEESRGTIPVPGTDPIDIENLWVRFAPEVKSGRLLLGTHYDTRPWPDREEDKSLHRVRGVIGACDGGSGTAILLELADLVGRKSPNLPIDIVLFDAEEPLGKEFIPQGYFLGSRRFVADRIQEGNLDQYSAVLVIDVVGGKKAQVGLDRSSMERAPKWSGRIQGVLDRLNLPSFRPPAAYSIWDDHTAFQDAGIPAALLIDYDYPYLDTLKDTLDKCDPETLRDVGQAVLQTALDHSEKPLR